MRSRLAAYWIRKRSARKHVPHWVYMLGMRLLVK